MLMLSLTAAALHGRLYRGVYDGPDGVASGACLVEVDRQQRNTRRRRQPGLLPEERRLKAHRRAVQAPQRACVHKCCMAANMTSAASGPFGHSSRRVLHPTVANTGCLQMCTVDHDSSSTVAI